MLAEFESRILALIDEMVDHASDDELFASGYLRGHLTLAALNPNRLWVRKLLKGKAVK